MYKIKCINDGKIFNNVAECAKHYDISKQTIFNCLNNKTKTKKGLEFEREEYVKRERKKIEFTNYKPVKIDFNYSKLNLREYIDAVYHKNM